MIFENQPNFSPLSDSSPPGKPILYSVLVIVSSNDGKTSELKDEATLYVLQAG
jgi:hypothetical protein